MSTDHELIRNIYARYCFATDRGTADDIAALFWEDCTVDFGGNINDGVEAACTGFAKWIHKMRDPVEGLRHCLYTPLIEIDCDHAAVEARQSAGEEGNLVAAVLSEMDSPEQYGDPNTPAIPPRTDYSASETS